MHINSFLSSPAQFTFWYWLENTHKDTPATYHLLPYQIVILLSYWTIFSQRNWLCMAKKEKNFGFFLKFKFKFSLVSRKSFEHFSMNALWTNLKICKIKRENLEYFGNLNEMILCTYNLNSNWCCYYAKIEHKPRSFFLSYCTKSVEYRSIIRKYIVPKNYKT